MYVEYLATKDVDGNWNYDNASIENIYAFVYETSEVISSERKSWQDRGTESYRKVTDEN